MGWWVYDLYQQDPMLLVSWAVWVIVSICLHELGHGVAAIRLGDRTPIELGRMTFNPLVHMGGTSLIVFALFGIAWGLMPINPRRLRGRYAASLVALAGPAVNLVLAVLCVVLAGVWLPIADGSWFGTPVPDPFARNMLVFLTCGGFINVLLLGFNLLPVPPLDGSRVCADFSAGYRRLFFESQQGAMIGFGVLMLVFIFGGRAIFPAFFNLTIVLRDSIAAVLGAGSGP